MEAHRRKLRRLRSRIRRLRKCFFSLAMWRPIRSKFRRLRKSIISLRSKILWKVIEADRSLWKHIEGDSED